LNIFYNRDLEINFLSELMEEEKILKDAMKYKHGSKRRNFSENSFMI
jgi:hypothetical protein